MFREVRGQRGVTLIELILFIVIISVAVVGIVQVMNLTTKGSADPVRRKQALMIAEALMEEVQLAKFTFCDPTSGNADTAATPGDCTIQEVFGPEPGTHGRPFDNVNDYVPAANTWTAAFNNGTGALVDVNGKPMDVQGYTARLMISPENLGGIAGVGPNGPEVLRITIEVTYDGGQTVVLDGYKTRYAPNFL